MEYGKIIAVTGLPGLYELISSKTDGAIVRSLEDKSTRFVSSRVHSFSHLESIEIYTVRDNVNMVDIFNAMEGSKEKAPDEKDNGGLKKYFEKVYPDIDFERVYASDMKKMIKWFAILKANNVEIKLTEEPEPVEEEPVEEPKEEIIVKKPKKAEPAKKETAKAAPASTPKKEKKEAETKKEPAKKAPAKAKKAAKKKEEPKKKTATKAAAKKKTKK
jgi:hypothetical protein